MMNTETAAIAKIRQSYLPKEQTKLERLKALDKRAKRPAAVFAYVYGSAASLVLGTGMCLAMKVLGSSMALGIGVGLVGIALTLSTYPIYKMILRARKEKYSKQIFALSDELLNK